MDIKWQVGESNFKWLLGPVAKRMIGDGYDLTLTSENSLET